MRTTTGYVLGLVGIALSTASIAQAGLLTTVPEIDASSITAGLGLLAAGVLIIRARRR